MALQLRHANTRDRARGRATPRTARRPMLEELEPRLVLAPMIADGVATASDLSDIYSIRQVTDQVTGRIEIAPVTFAGGDTFVVERLGPDPNHDGIDERPGAPEVGTISRVSRGGKVSFFASVPGGDLGFGGYVNFFDLVFDPIGIFDGVPSLFVGTSSQVEDPATPMRENAIYRFDASGNLLNGGPFAYFTEDSDGDLTFDDHPTLLAIAPLGSKFEPGLYVADVEQETATEGDDLFIFQPGYAPGAEIGGGLLPTGVRRVLDLADNVTPPDGPLPDLDLRSIIFDPGTLYEGTLIGNSTDLEDGTAATTLEFDPPQAQSASPFPTTLAEPLSVHHWTDATFDPSGFFSTNETGVFVGSYFAADNAGGGNFTNLRGVVHRISPTGTFNVGGVQDPFAFNFNVGITDLAIDPAGGLERAFSLSLSPDGQRLQVADLDGIWEIISDVALPCSDAGRLTGVCDVLVGLGRPYLGAGTAVAVLDSGVDGTHPGFGGLVSQGTDAVFGGSGDVDFDGHGTAVAGIIHQIAPEAVIVPITVLSQIGGVPFTSREILWDGIKYVADNPLVVNPLTGQLARIVAGNLSLGTPDVYDSEAEAAVIDDTTLFTWKDQFQRWAAENILPVASAGNDGLLFGGAAMDAMSSPAVINEVLSVGASYPFGPTDANNFPTPAPAGSAIVPGDNLATVDKVAAFSDRNQDMDFIAPGVALRTFNPINFGATPSGLPPINLDFVGTSGSSPYVTGVSVMAYSAVQFWAHAAAAHSSTAAFLGGSSSAPISLPGIPNLGAYLTPDGINAILQWTAVPHEDVNLILGAPDDDDVEQQGRLVIYNHQLTDSETEFRVYSRVDAGNAIAAIEGTIAFNYFNAHAALIGQLDANHDGTVTASEIQAFVDNPANDATARAMAGLLGGTSSAALQNRTAFFDSLDGPNPLLQPAGIHVSQFGVLASTLLPSTDKFHITGRIANGNEGYLVAPDEVRNWHDLTLMLPSANFVSGVPSVFQGKGPDFFGASLANTLIEMIPRDPRDVSNQQPPGGQPPGGDSGGQPPGDEPPPTPGDGDPGGTDNTGDQSLSASVAVFRDGIWFIDGDHAGGAAEKAFAFGVPDDVPLSGDFNHDGRTDAAVFRNGIWFFDLDGKGGAAEKAFAFGIPGDLPVSGDFNNDGRTDVAVFRNGIWFIDLDGKGGAAEKAFAFGMPGDVPVSGDVNGDGRADAGVFRNGLWFFDLNGVGGAAERALAFGIPGDVPVVGSWQKGVAGPAVFRNGLWFFDMDGKGGAAEKLLTFGMPGDVPLAFPESLTQTSTGPGAPDQSDQSGGGSGALPPPDQMGGGTSGGSLQDPSQSDTGSGSGGGLMSLSATSAVPHPAAGTGEIDLHDEQDVQLVDQALEGLTEEWTLESPLL